MGKEFYASQDERTMAAMAHGSILLGGSNFTNAGIGKWLKNDDQVYAGKGND